MKFPKMPTHKLLQRLEPARGKIRCVLDTDTYNEVDDQFAIAHALLSNDSVEVEAIYAAPFHNSLSTGPADGMNKSVEEIHRVLQALSMPLEHLVYKGSTGFLTDLEKPFHSEAALDLVQRALSADEDEPLYVVAIGAITNIASALLIEPGIINKIVVVWLGGHALHWPHVNEFNLRQDVTAAKLVLDCGVPLVLIPCLGVASHLSTTVAELENHLKDCGTIGHFLISKLTHFHDNHFAYSKIIWDIAATGYLIVPQSVTTEIVHSPILTEQMTWSFDASRHFIRYASYVERNLVFGDLFEKLKR